MCRIANLFDTKKESVAAIFQSVKGRLSFQNYQKRAVAFPEMALCTVVRRNYGRKLLVVSNVIISILLKWWFSYDRVSMKQQEYHI